MDLCILTYKGHSSIHPLLSPDLNLQGAYMSEGFTDVKFMCVGYLGY